MEGDDAGDERPSSGDLIAAAAVDEKRLIRDEVDAERSLAKAIDRRERARLKLDRAQARFDAREEAVQQATAALRERQQARAAGPVYAASAAAVQAPGSERPAPPESDAPARPRRRAAAKPATGSTVEGAAPD